MQRVLKPKNIEVLFNHETVEILGDNTVSGVKVKNNVSLDEKIEATGFFRY